jgi:hypothetical protein
MKTFVTTAAFFLAVTQFHALSATLDDFSGTTSSDSANYTTLLSYTASSDTTPETFSINSSGQLQPTSSGTGKTTTFLWNGGQTFALGDTVSIDIDNVSAYNNLAGLAFTTSATSANGSGDNYIFAGLLSESPDSSNVPATVGEADIDNVVGVAATFNFSLGSVTESATRTATGFDYRFSGPGLTSGPITGSYAVPGYDGQTVYFGINIYGGDSPGDQVVDNLDLTVPEPSTYAMLLGGVALLALVARSRKWLRA